MTETTMPTTEVMKTEEQELISYEFAFHVLPTVAEGEVPGVFDTLKALITKAGGTLLSEEMPQRFDLAYEIEKYLEGKNRKFSSSYFGWVRFTMTASGLLALTEEIDGQKPLLRYLLLKLTKVEVENTFRFHDALVHKKVHTITDEEVVVEETESTKEEADEVAEDAVAEVAADVVEEDSTDNK